MHRKIFILAAIAGLALTAFVLSRLAGLSWLNIPGLVLVIGGTLIASVIGHSGRSVLDLLHRLPKLYREPVEPGSEDYQPFLHVAELYRRGSVRAAENAVLAIRDPFLNSGARLALDPHSGEELARVLQWRMRRQKEADNADIRILRTMATFAPAFGMLGTLVGLVGLLGSLGQAELDYIGVSMGFALMSTLYGLLAANLLFRPLALKLEDRSRQNILHLNFLLDAITMLYERQHPALIGEYLDSARSSSVREEGDEHPARAPSPSMLRMRA